MYGQCSRFCSESRSRRDWLLLAAVAARPKLRAALPLLAPGAHTRTSRSIYSGVPAFAQGAAAGAIMVSGGRPLLLLAVAASSSSRPPETARRTAGALSSVTAR
jgi:hypothetical protein